MTEKASYHTNEDTMTLTIPDLYIAACSGFGLGVLAVIGLAWTLAAAQSRRNRRP